MSKEKRVYLNCPFDEKDKARRLGAKWDKHVKKCFVPVEKDYDDFEVYETPDDGQIVFKIQKSITSSKRGIMLLELESKLKENIDNALTVWLEPVGDKSKLRNLRGIKIKPENN